MFAWERTACWPTATVAGRPARHGTHIGTDTGWTRWKRNGPAAGYRPNVFVASSYATARHGHRRHMSVRPSYVIGIDTKLITAGLCGFH